VFTRVESNGGTAANAPQFSEYGPSRYRLDLSLFKEFGI
jgi:hypothetical protein